MNIPILKILLLLLIFSNFIFSQETPEAKLIDEFGKITCEDVLQRTDAFIVELQNNPAAKGFFVIDLGNEKTSFGIRYERWLIGHLNLRKFDLSRIKTIRTSSAKEFIIRFWLVSERSQEPEYVEKDWDFTFYKNQKPFIFSANYYDGSLCPGVEILSLNYFAEYMKANPKSRSNIVIKTISDKKFFDEKKELLELIVDKYKISSKRIRFFRVRKNHYWSDGTPEVEVWILP